jgi:protein gp37
MGEASAIEWTNATWNPWMGCTKVSPGCARCYMFREQRQYGHDPEVVRRSKTKFTDPLKWPDGRLIFTCSWSDWFHEGADAWRAEAWTIIRETPRHTYQILTKRPERILLHLPPDWGIGYPNVWLGVSVENQRHAFRAGLLAQVPAAVRFISAEPLLGHVDLRPWLGQIDRRDGVFADDPMAAVLMQDCVDQGLGDARRLLDWVIAGGESGPKSRPMDLAWARDLRDQCLAAHVPFFLKQLGGWPDKRGGDRARLDGQRWTQMPQLELA